MAKIQNTVSIFPQKIKFLFKLLFSAYWSVLYTMNGGLAGMVAACAGCNNMHQWAAFVIGLMAGANYYLYSELLVKAK